MNLNDILRTENINDQYDRTANLLSAIRSLFSLLLSMMRALIFWIIMIALLTSPAWLPVVVDGVLRH